MDLVKLPLPHVTCLSSHTIKVGHIERAPLIDVTASARPFFMS